MPYRDGYKKQKRRRRLWKIGLVIFGLLLLLGGLSYLSYRPSLRVSAVTLSGGELVTDEEVESETLSFLLGSYFWLFPRNNAYLYPKDALENRLSDRFKRIATIQISRLNSNTLSVAITERQPESLWCHSDGFFVDDVGTSAMPDAEEASSTIPIPGEFSPETAASAEVEKCYFMDVNGIIFSDAPDFSGDAYFKYYGLVSTSPPVGQTYAGVTEEFARLSGFIAEVENLSLRPVSLAAETAGVFSLTLSGGGRIIFSMESDLVETAANLDTFLRAPALGEAATLGSRVDYIDLRFGNKVFYKMKDIK